MDNLPSLLFDWLILAALLAALVYVLLAIRQESSDFLDESYLVSFGRLSLPIPRWWSVTRQEARLIEFRRTDTRYDWYARFEFVPADTSVPLTEYLARKVEAEQLDYDKDDVVIETEPSHLFKDAAVQAYFREAIRVEGKASLQVEERVYLDLYMFRSQAEGGHYICESRSSVLNGLVEGPFFEECLSLLKLDA